MKIKYVIACHLLFPLHAFAASSFFCPQNYGNITLGMTQEEVVSACGQPVSKQESDKPIMRKVPMTQMYFNNQGTNRASVLPATSVDIYAGLWSNATGVNGTSVQVDIIDNKIYAIQLNASEENAFSLCGGQGIQIGDPVSKVINACGTPLLTNKTFINQEIIPEKKPEIWIYQPGQFQPTLSLTFVDGKLQSIN